jgi:hypothetical protein
MPLLDELLLGDPKSSWAGTYGDRKTGLGIFEGVDVDVFDLSGQYIDLGGQLGNLGGIGERAVNVRVVQENLLRGTVVPGVLDDDFDVEEGCSRGEHTTELTTAWGAKYISKWD